MHTVTSSEAKPILAELVRRAEAGEEIHLTKYGNTQAVLIGWEQYNRYRRTLMQD